MPDIHIYLCKHCKTTFDVGWGGYQYVESIDGERIPCPHPGEDTKIAEVLGIDEEDIQEAKEGKLSWWWSKNRKERYKQVRRLIEDRTGYNSACFCIDCKKTIHLDIGNDESDKNSWRYYYRAVKQKDKRQCMNCRSSNVKTIIELLNKSCPICIEGKIEAVKTGLHS